MGQIFYLFFVRALFLFVGAVAKLAQFSLHVWLPEKQIMI